MADLIKFAQFHGLKVAKIADLIAYRLRNDRIVERRAETVIDSKYGGKFRMLVFVNKIAYAEHIALVRGEVSDGPPPLVRMHALDVLHDVLGERAHDRGGEIEASMRLIAEAGRGVLVLIREPGATNVSDTVAARHADAAGRPTGLRDYGIGAQILLDLGIRNMILLSNTERTIVGLAGYGLTVVERRPIPTQGG